MSFQWNFTRQPNLSEYEARKAAEEMIGYRPSSALTPSSPAEQAAAAMRGYAPSQSSQFSVPNDQHGGYAQPDLDGYGDSLQASSNAVKKELKRQQRIEVIKAKIRLVQNRLAENMAKLKNFTGSAEAIAALEAQKINSPDPTMIWRWQKQREDTARANERAMGQAGKNWKNTESMYLDEPMSNTMSGLEQQMRNIQTAIRDGKNYGQDTSSLVKKLREYQEIYASGGPEGVRALNLFNNKAANPDADTDELFRLAYQLPEDKQKDALDKVYKLEASQQERAKKKAASDAEKAKKKSRSSIFGD